MPNEWMSKEDLEKHLEELMIEHGFLNPDGSVKYLIVPRRNEFGAVVCDLVEIDLDVTDLNSC